jgi:hypothetical protein
VDSARFKHRKAENSVQHSYEVQPRKDHRGFDLISDQEVIFPNHEYEYVNRLNDETQPDAVMR